MKSQLLHEFPYQHTNWSGGSLALAGVSCGDNSVLLLFEQVWGVYRGVLMEQGAEPALTSSQCSQLLEVRDTQ